jgi:hypothetical protein
MVTILKNEENGIFILGEARADLFSFDKTPMKV